MQTRPQPAICKLRVQCFCLLPLIEAGLWAGGPLAGAPRGHELDLHNNFFFYPGGPRYNFEGQAASFFFFLTVSSPAILLFFDILSQERCIAKRQRWIRISSPACCRPAKFVSTFYSFGSRQFEVPLLFMPLNVDYQTPCHGVSNEQARTVSGILQDHTNMFSPNVLKPKSLLTQPLVSQHGTGQGRNSRSSKELLLQT